jgi:hypothetical protein
MQRQQTETGKQASCGAVERAEKAREAQEAKHLLLCLLKGGEWWGEKAYRLPLERPYPSAEANRGRPWQD